MIKPLNNKKGFTLIEIVLVLAIAALIMVIVFVALQGAQRSRRDTARKNDAGRLLAGVESCASNNQGQYTNCTTQAQLVTAGYFNGTDPGNGAAYTVVAAAPAQGQFEVLLGGTCPSQTQASAARVIAWQEVGGTYCVGN